MPSTGGQVSVQEKVDPISQAAAWIANVPQTCHCMGETAQAATAGLTIEAGGAACRYGRITEFNKNRALEIKFCHVFLQQIACRNWHAPAWYQRGVRHNGYQAVAGLAAVGPPVSCTELQ